VDCREFSSFFQLYVDKELDKEEETALLQHLAGCSSCQVLADYEQRFVNAIRARIPKVVAPPHLKAKIITAMETTKENRFFSRRLVLSSVPALIVILLIIPFTWTVTSGFSSLADEAVKKHSYASPMEFSNSDSDQVENWFREKVDFNVAIPKFTRRKVDLIGARLSQLAKSRAALVRYRRGMHNFSLFVVTDPGGSLGGNQCQKVKTKEFCITELKGYTVIQWRSRGLAYSLVGDEAPQDMIDVLSSASSL
jgi:anti-sigma factor (TIGR02949 family)